MQELLAILAVLPLPKFDDIVPSAVTVNCIVSTSSASLFVGAWRQHVLR